VLGPWEFLWRAGSCIYSVFVSLFCEIGGPVQFLFGHSGGVDGGTVQIFLFLWLCSGGYCTGEMVRGGDPIFLLFLQLAVSSFGGWILVGILCYIFCWKICIVISRFLIL
jgi:hypothetical protein